MSLEDLIDLDVDAVSMGLASFEKLVTDAASNIVNATSELVAVDIRRDTTRDDLFYISFSYTGWNYGEIKVFICES